jgi:hypothetical protein
VLIGVGRGPNSSLILFVFHELSELLVGPVGLLLIGVAYVRARVLPPWGSIALITLIVGGGLQPFFVSAGKGLNIMMTAAAFLFGCIWLALSYVIWFSRNSATPP